MFTNLKNNSIKAAALVALLSCFSSSVPILQAQDFKEFEIRVIRPKFFMKRMRFELGTQFNAIMNQTFIYTYSLGGSLGFHFTDSLGLEIGGSYGFSVDKEDKSTLKDNFDINTLIVRKKYDLTGTIMWTPIYGKYQLTSGRLIYFDTFISAGAGLVGAEWLYDHCPNPNEFPDGATIQEAPAENTQAYFGYVLGIGQRYFLNKNLSLRWDLKGRFFTYDAVDGDCARDSLQEQGTTISKTHINVNLGIGVSYFL